VRSIVQVYPGPPSLLGGVAQLGEHLLCKQEVIGSNPFASTNFLVVVFAFEVVILPLKRRLLKESEENVFTSGLLVGGKKCSLTL
jgi:hypothetical protein